MFPRTTLARRHLDVIAKAPEDMKARMRAIASAACGRLYDETEDLDAYLDSEDFYYNTL